MTHRRMFPRSMRETPLSMARIFLAVFLIVFGVNMLFGIGLPTWLLGLLALIPGVLLLAEHYQVRIDRK